MRLRISAMIFVRATMFLCSVSRRRSRKRYFRRMSSGYSGSPNTGSGNSLAADRISISRAKTSISPVGRFGLTVSAMRALTSPSTRIDPFAAHGLGDLEGRRIRIGDDLRQAVVVAQVDEQQAAMVADTMNPAGKADARPDIGFLEVGRRYGCGSGAWSLIQSGALGRCRRAKARPEIRAKSACRP